MSETKKISGKTQAAQKGILAKINAVPSKDLREAFIKFVDSMGTDDVKKLEDMQGLTFKGKPLRFLTSGHLLRRNSGKSTNKSFKTIAKGMDYVLAEIVRPEGDAKDNKKKEQPTYKAIAAYPEGTPVNVVAFIPTVVERRCGEYTDDEPTCWKRLSNFSSDAAVLARRGEAEKEIDDIKNKFQAKHKELYENNRPEFNKKLSAHMRTTEVANQITRCVGKEVMEKWKNPTGKPCPHLSTRKCKRSSRFYALVDIGAEYLVVPFILDGAINHSSLEFSGVVTEDKSGNITGKSFDLGVFEEAGVAEYYNGILSDFYKLEKDKVRKFDESNKNGNTLAVAYKFIAKEAWDEETTAFVNVMRQIGLAYGANVVRATWAPKEDPFSYLSDLVFDEDDEFEFSSTEAPDFDDIDINDPSVLDADPTVEETK